MADSKSDDGTMDVAKWGTAAMFAGGLAVASAALSLVLPPGFQALIQADRGGATNPAMLESRLAQVLTEQRELARENNLLKLQITQMQRERTLVSERVGALETAVPMLLEAVPPDQEIDRSLVTGSVEPDVRTEIFDAVGGSVQVVQRPLFPSRALTGALTSDPPPPVMIAPPDPNPPMPDEAVVANAKPDQTQSMLAPSAGTDFGLAIGQPMGPLDAVGTQQALDNWQDILGKVGLLLIGLEPQIADPLDSGQARLVAGPLSDIAAAEDICTRVVQVGIECLPVQYHHQPGALSDAN